jgi:hypothetical protein
MELYRKYEVVRESGITNMMFCDYVCKLSGLTKDEYIFVRDNYLPLSEQARKEVAESDD